VTAADERRGRESTLIEKSAYLLLLSSDLSSADPGVTNVFQTNIWPSREVFPSGAAPDPDARSGWSSLD
jgi:hypothetical protein